MPSLIPNVESGKFSTSKKKILFQNHMNWDILQSWKIFYFYWKISTLVKIFSLFWTSKRAQIQSKWRNWKIFHFGGKFSTSKNLQKKKFFLQNCMNWNILQRELFSEKSEIFPLFRFFRKFRKFIFLGLQVCQVSGKSKKLFLLHHHHHSSSSSSSWPLAALVVVQVRGVQVGTTLRVQD